MLFVGEAGSGLAAVGSIRRLGKDSVPPAGEGWGVAHLVDPVELTESVVTPALRRLRDAGSTLRLGAIRDASRTATVARVFLFEDEWYPGDCGEDLRLHDA